MNSLNQLSTKARVILVIIIATLSLALIGVLLQKDENFETFGEGFALDHTVYAMLVEGTELLDNLSSMEEYDRFARDLRVFAKAAYPEYSDEGSLIAFKITSPVRKDGDSLSFNGRFGSVENKIDATIRPLGKNRIKTSITDTKTKLNIDPDLPSNSIREQFIGSLPHEGEGYLVDYNDTTDSFFINLRSNTAAVRQEAEQFIASSLKLKDIQDERVEVLGGAAKTSPYW